MTWDFLVNPLITLMTLFYSIFGNNIVVAIAILTVLIRLLVSPLLIQQQRSAAAAQELQPKIKQLQEKYKNDRDKLAQAQMELYREHGVNPLAGCLPLLIQLPILFALYATITHSLSSTPYQLVDLSQRLLVPDLERLLPLNKIWLGMDLTQTPMIVGTLNPLAFALPVLVLVTTWLQSKLTIPAPPPSTDGQPNPAESMTKSMTTIMPLMFGFFALSFPIGLSIYFIVGNLVGIAQYTAMGKADWRGLLGLPPLEKDKGLVASSSNGRATSGEAIEVMSKAKNSNGTVASEVIKAKPVTQAAKGKKKKK